MTWNQLHSALPRHIFKKSALKGLSYVVRDVTLAILLYRLAWSLDTIATTLVGSWNASQTHLRMLKWMLWIIYFNVQGILLTSWWCLAHEASHGTLSSFTLVNDLVGFVLHTVNVFTKSVGDILLMMITLEFLLVPYFSWKSSHLSHHKFTVSVERDENYVPPSRSNFSLPPDTLANAADYREALEETPIYTALRLVAMQVLGLISYLLFNCKGSPRHPPGTNVSLNLMTCFLLTASTAFQPLLAAFQAS